jgi:hypothetical protein
VEAKMTLHIVASSDAEGLAIRDHLVPIVREHGVLQDFEDKSSPLRLLVLEHKVWRFMHWTPFNALTPGQASSPGYRHALEYQRTRPDLPYGLDVWHADTNVLSLLWADPGTFEIVTFRRGAWETEAMAL